MASKSIRNVKITDSLTLSECSDGYWLYDKTMGYNLAMKAETAEDAITEALITYQKKFQEMKQKKKNYMIV